LAKLSEISKLKLSKPDTKKLFSMNNRVVLLTGATGHLGKMLATGLAEAGATVILNGRDLDSLETLQAELNIDSTNHIVVPFDVTNETAVSSGIQSIIKTTGKLDVVINNAYSGRAGCTLDQATEADFNRSHQINVLAPFLVYKYARDLLRQSASLNPFGSSIINISSMYSQVSPDPRIYGESEQNNPPFYGATKAGMNQLTRYIACHEGEHNIRANTLCPGPFPEGSISDSNPEFHRSLCEKTPLGRVGFSHELIGPVLFLASDASSYVTGTNINVDGGWTAW
jgi:NAD(P)-dependent dehydrogenase (short-subunit alcohol dehydrogenase family)